MDPDFREITLQNFQSARNEKANCIFDNRILNKELQPVDMRWSIYWSDAEQRNFCVAHDISDQKRSERLRKEVLDMVTHDLRTPLASIELSIDMLQHGHKGVLSGAAVDELEKIKRNSSQLMQLVNDLLDMEKIKEGKLKLVRKEVNLQLIVENAFQLVSPVAARRKIGLIEQNTDLDIYADGVRILQVLVNLLSNALKFSPENSEIVVEAQMISAGTDDANPAEWVLIKVIDQGPGMTKEEASSLFQRFAQLESHVQQGSGLGLAICRALIDLHGGKIGVDAEKGKGSTFWFRFPARACPLPLNQ